MFWHSCLDWSKLICFSLSNRRWNLRKNLESHFNMRIIPRWGKFGTVQGLPALRQFSLLGPGFRVPGSLYSNPAHLSSVFSRRVRFECWAKLVQVELINCNSAWISFVFLLFGNCTTAKSGIYENTSRVRLDFNACSSDVKIMTRKKLLNCTN